MIRVPVWIPLIITFLIPLPLSASDENASVAVRDVTIENLWPEGAPIGDGQTEEVAVKLEGRIPDGDGTVPVPAVVICPGGGYGGLCVEPEGYGIADWLNRHGIAGFVLTYRLPAGRKTVPLSDAQRAIQTVRARASEFGVDPDKIGIIGFSAGGHLAASASVHYLAGDPNASDPIAQVSSRPDFSVLIYPVISMVSDLTHEGTRTNLLGENPTAEEIDYYSNEKQITTDTPPAFLAHAKDDTVVPPENSALYAKRMEELGRPVIYLTLPDGGHGLNGYKGDSWDRWQNDAAEWIWKITSK